MSSIEWTGKTWNPTTGCDKVSRGCKHCYAEVMHKRLAAMGQKKYAMPFLGGAQVHESTLTIPMKIKKPTTWFVNSMSDLFHKDVPFDFIDKVFAVMALCPQHTFQILTKRPERMVEYFKERRDEENFWHYAESICGEFTGLFAGKLPEGFWWDKTVDADALKDVSLEWDGEWPLQNVWLGTSCENQKAADERIPNLLNTPAAVRFLSCEPMVGQVDLSSILHFKDHFGNQFYRDVLNQQSYCSRDDVYHFPGMIDWVIAGGESGSKATPMHPDWVRRLRDQCQAAGVPFFFKQWGEWANGSYWSSMMNNTMAAVLSNGDFGPFHPGSAIQKKYSNDEWQKLKPYAMSRVGKKKSGRLLDGRTWDEMPKVSAETELNHV